MIKAISGLMPRLSQQSNSNSIVHRQSSRKLHSNTDVYDNIHGAAQH